MPIDREAALKKAEKLLRQGQLRGAIQEYVRLIEDQPRDVNAINALGDLYIRAGDTERAVAQFTHIADRSLAEGALPRAQAFYKKTLKAQPHHEHSLSQLADIAYRQHRLADAKEHVRHLAERRRLRGDERGVADCVERMRALDGTDAEASPTPALPTDPGAGEAADDPARVFEMAKKQLASGNELQGRAVLMRALTLDAARHGDVVQLALEWVAQGRIETAFGCLDVATDAALLGGDWTQAIEALQTFVRAAPHPPALIKLVELCVDAGLDGPLRASQAQLADAYLDMGKGAEARVIAEDLLERDPECEAHAHRLRRATELLGSPDGDRAVADVRGRRRAVESAEPDRDSHTAAAAGMESVEIDLSDVLARIGGTDSSRADDPFARAVGHLQAGRTEQGIADLQEAARAPHTTVRAAAELGRLYVGRGELEMGVEWLERAADGQAPTREEGCAVLYDLAGALERLGEPARALAVLIDLDADAAGYRDVRRRIEQLARTQAQAGSHQR
ncbi:MAG: tetratricopeptide repeat protein [Vicinamibacterales bacterium]